MTRNHITAPAPRVILLALALFLLFALPLPAWPQEPSPVAGVLRNAHRMKLHEERTWEVLLHYKKTFSGGYRSRIDDPNFFLSPTGRTDRKGELEATLKAFFIPPSADGTHAACRFPARYEWLRDRLDLDASELPHFTCSERDRALATVNGRSAVLVFPVGHINSPASMFGHTLLRIDGPGKSTLISHAANYAATATDTNGFVYAWKGLFGLYKGYYSMTPYYLKVKEYSDLEHRDMWEYRLRLSPREIGSMLNHIWELQNIHSPYFFLDENCSYNLLFLIEAARPELRLTERTGIFALPTHTIRIALESGILEAPRFRPSQGTRIRKIASLLEDGHQKIAYALAQSIREPATLAEEKLSEGDRAKVLDLAAEYVQMRFARKELEKGAYSRLYLRLLGERSSLGTPRNASYEIEEPSRPETGHGTTKIAAGGGIRRGRMFAEMEIQPQFHALLDPDQGYLQGSQIKFLDTSVVYDFSTAEVELKKLHIVDILSITPRTLFFRPFSWKVNTGIDREVLRDGEDHLIFRLNTGGGYSWPSPFNGIWYALGEIDINGGEGIRTRITAGPGLSLGALEQLTERWKAHLYAKGFVYKAGDDRVSLELGLAQNLRITRNNSVSIEFSGQRVNSHHVEETAMLWNYYF